MTRAWLLTVVAGTADDRQESCVQQRLTENRISTGSGMTVGATARATGEGKYRAFARALHCQPCDGGWQSCLRATVANLVLAQGHA